MGKTEDFLATYKKENEDFYTEPEPSLHGRRRPRIARAGILFLFILAFSAVLGYFLFQSPGTSVASDAGSIAIEGPAFVRPHEEVAFTINYRNNRRAELSDGSVEIRYPHGFEVIEVVPSAENAGQNFWRIQPLRAFASEKITVRGRFVVTDDEQSAPPERNLQARFTYQDPGVRTRFTSEATLAITLGERSESGSLTGPERTVKNKEIEYAFRIDDVESLPSGSTVEIVHDRVFVVSETIPKASTAQDGTLAWSYPTLRVHAHPTSHELVLRVKGRYTDSSKDEPFRLAARFLLPENTKPIREFAHATMVADSVASVRISVNETSDPQPLNYGDSFVLGVAYENQTDAELSSAKISVTIDGPVDWSSAKSDASFVRDGSTLVWAAETVPSLKNIAPRAGGTLTVLLSAGSAPDDFMEAAQGTLTITAHMDGGPERISSEPLVIRFNSDTKLETSIRKSESGFAVLHTISNTLHGLENLSLTAGLPPDSSVSGIRVSAGSAHHDENTDVLAWKLNRLPQAVKNVTIEYSVVTSNALDGSLLLQARDSATQGTITRYGSFKTVSSTTADTGTSAQQNPEGSESVTSGQQ